MPLLGNSKRSVGASRPLRIQGEYLIERASCPLLFSKIELPSSCHCEVVLLGSGWLAESSSEEGRVGLGTPAPSQHPLPGGALTRRVDTSNLQEPLPTAVSKLPSQDKNGECSTRHLPDLGASVTIQKVLLFLWKWFDFAVSNVVFKVPCKLVASSLYLWDYAPSVCFICW